MTTRRGVDYNVGMDMKRCMCVLLAAVSALAFAGCAARTEDEAAAVPEVTAAALPVAEDIPLLDLNLGGDVPEKAIWTAADRLTITAPGTYRLTGALAGRVTVDADGPVTLVLEGVSLTGESCLDVRSGEPVTLYGAAGTENIFTDALPEPASGEASSPEPSEDAAVEDAENDEPEADEETDASGAVITSKAPLFLAGGSVTVKANVNNGIRAKDGFTMLSGILTVNAAHHGVKARGDLAILGGTASITAGGDALRAEAGRVIPGTVEISGGSVTLTAGADGIRADKIAVTDGALTLDSQGDGIQAATDLSVSGGELSITTGGGGGSAIDHAGESFGPWGQNADDDTVSTKGLKSDGSITISGGVVVLNTADDSIHCETLFTMDGGTVTICSNDDAIHSGDMLVINDGVLRIDDCFEGLEAFAVEVRGGDVTIRAVNDGINANGSEMMFFRASSVAEETEITSLSGSATTYVLMAGGRVDLVVTGNSRNQGDGVDSNGAVYITGGEMIVSTFGTYMENGLDTGWGGPVVTGGRVIAGGSSTMAEGFGSASTQCAAVVSTSYMPDGTEVILSDAEGNVLWSVVLADAFSCIQISHPDMQMGQVYTLTYGGESTTLDFTSSNLFENTRGFGFFPF